LAEQPGALVYSVGIEIIPLEVTLAHLASVTLPDFGRPDTLPTIQVATYVGRIESLVARMDQTGYDALVVYADREHMANMSYLTGFDPRFEEALLVLDRQGQRLLIVGNECMGYLPDPAIGCEVALFQSFSLMGQPRGASRPLGQILRDAGVESGSRVGCVGWKYYDEPLVPAGAAAIELPAYIVDQLRDMVGPNGTVRNAGTLLMGVSDGLRLVNEPEQIAQFEFASTRTSEGTLAVMRGIKPGVRESALESLLTGDGLTLSCHRMISFGAKAQRGLASPSGNCAQLGDAYTIGYGLTGALTSRAGVVAHSANELSGELQAFYPAYVGNYFDVVATWYEALRVGVAAGEVFAAVEAAREPRLYDFSVNPGHYLHLDEWVHSPFTAGSRIPLRSGMALQMDIIPLSKGPFCYTNVEDGVVLADAELCGKLAASYPAAWQRIQARRAFMADALGIAVDESVLPLSNMPAWLPPYVLDLRQALVKD
jgi:hypothetical protein